MPLPVVELSEMSIKMSTSEMVFFLVLLTIALGGVFFMRDWKKAQQAERSFRERELNLREYEIESNLGSGDIKINNNNESREEERTDLNGYTFMIVDEDKKALFSDMLKGFEDYAKLKGYKVSLSLDTSINGKIGFKFTLHEHGISVSTQKVKQDINNYINDVMSGGSFDDIPVLITAEEHSAVIGTLKARLKFIEYSHSLEKENKEFFQNLINKMANHSINHQPANINFIQEGIEMDSRKYSANNSANVVQGDGSTNRIENSTVQIGKNVAEINSQLETLKDTLNAIEVESNENEALKPVVRHLENIKEELEESSSPDTSIIEKWLSKANKAFEIANATLATGTKFKILLTAFGFLL